MYSIFEELLRQRNLKTSDVVKATNISATFFSEWKKGKSKNPNPNTLKKIADYFGVSVDYLMTGKNNEFTIEMAQKDIRLSKMNERIKDYALLLADLPLDKQEHIFNLIDMLK